PNWKAARAAMAASCTTPPSTGRWPPCRRRRRPGATRSRPRTTRPAPASSPCAAWRPETPRRARPCNAAARRRPRWAELPLFYSQAEPIERRCVCLVEPRITFVIPKRDDGSAMFEFGRDLRRLFEKARDSDDLGWLELIGAGLVEVEARQQATDAGRVSCARPFEAALRAAALWREHARRCGAAASINRAEAAGRDAAKAAANDDQAVRAALDLAQTGMLAFDLRGGPERLTAALGLLAELPAARRADTASAMAALRSEEHTSELQSRENLV